MLWRPVVHCTSSMSTWFGGITWLSWPYGWGNSQAEVRQRLLKAWAQPSCEALGQSMVKFQWNGLCGGFHTPVHWQKISPAIDPLQKNAIEQLQTSQDFCDGNWPRTNPYHSSFAVATLGIDISVNTQCHDMSWPSTEEYWNAKANGSLLFFHILLPCFLSSINCF